MLPLAEAETDTDTLMLALMLVAALTAAPIWAPMHIAWSANDWANLGPMSLRSFAVASTFAAASASGLARAVAENSFGRPSRIALSVSSSFLVSTTSLASASTVSLGSVHSAWIDALTDAAALHSPPE